MSKEKISPDALILHNNVEYKFKDLINLLLKSYTKIK